jgi:hypothetical protein
MFKKRVGKKRNFTSMAETVGEE